MLGLGILAAGLTAALFLMTHLWYDAKCSELRRMLRIRKATIKDHEETITKQRREISRLRLIIDNQRDEHAEETAALRAEIAGLKSREKVRADIAAAYKRA